MLEHDQGQAHILAARAEGGAGAGEKRDSRVRHAGDDRFTDHLGLCGVCLHLKLHK